MGIFHNIKDALNPHDASKEHDAPKTAQTRRAGLLHGEVTWWSRGLAGRCGHDGFVLDGCQPAEAGLPAAAVVGAFDPDDDRHA